MTAAVHEWLTEILVPFEDDVHYWLTPKGQDVVGTRKCGKGHVISGVNARYRRGRGLPDCRECNNHPPCKPRKYASIREAALAANTHRVEVDRLKRQEMAEECEALGGPRKTAQHYGSTVERVLKGLREAGLDPC